MNPKFKGTNKVWWSFPEAKFKTLMDLISLYSSTPGGGLSFSVSGRGDIDMVDVKNRFENDIICKVDGTIYTDTKNTDWAIRIPSRLKLHISTPTTNIIEDLDLGEGKQSILLY